MPGRTVLTVLENTAKQYGDAIALYQPIGGKGSEGYRTYTWNEWLRTAREIALGLRSLGLKKGEIVFVLSETRAEFYLVDIGIMAAGGISGALYTAYPMAELAKNLAAVQPRFLFAEDAGTAERLKEAAQSTAWPECVILMTGGEAPGAITVEDLRLRGQEIAARDAEAFAKMVDEISPDDGAILYLTSGATGEPKMGISSHAAILANIDTAPVVLPVGPTDSTIVFLPSAHIAQRVVLRDVREDAGMQRIYLPREDLVRFGVTAEQLRSGIEDERFQKLMQFEAARARKYYEESAPLMDLIEKRSRRSLWALRAIYMRLLSKIEKRRYKVLSDRISVTKPAKIAILLQAFLPK